VLRQVALDDPLQYLAVLASPEARGFMEAMFDFVCKQCQKQGEEPDFAPEDVKIHPVRIKDYPCAIIEMPPPKGTTEAFFTALVLLQDLASASVPEDIPLSARYFTLEKGFSLDGRPRTVLAEWSESGHSNYGDGPV